MRSLLIAFLFAVIPASAAVVRDPQSGIWLGNICKTPRGEQFVAFQPVGTTCWSNQWQSYGFIANY